MDKFSSENLKSTLGSVCEAAGIPGASASWLTREGQLDSQFGVESTRTGTPVSLSTVFQIGSITKVYTSYLAFQLVAQSKCSLDDSLTAFLPELVDIVPLSGDISIRSLLSHTSGLDGDVWIDTGRGDDCLEKYLAQFPSKSLLHPPGQRYSYCNAGFILLGLAMSRVSAQTWEELVQKEIFDRHALAQTSTLPEQAILHGAAVGHLYQSGALTASTVWQEPRSCGPAGIITAPPSDVIKFAKALMTETNEFELMTAPIVPIPGSGTPSSYGLGWRVWDCENRVVGHDGKSRGQATYLRMLPEAGEALVFSTNRSDTDAAAHEFFTKVLGNCVGSTVAGLREPDRTCPVDQSLVGSYKRNGGAIEIEMNGAEMNAFKTSTGPFYGGGKTSPSKFRLSAEMQDPAKIFAVGQDTILDIRLIDSDEEVQLFFGDRYYRKA